MAKLVFNIRAASASDIRNLSSHEQHRKPDGNSAIDVSRSHLNRTIYSFSHEGTQSKSLDSFLMHRRVKKPAKQAEAPYVQMVIGAGADFFRPENPSADGTFENERVEVFEKETLAWLRETFGDDLIHVSLHLDETTPHVHVLIAPTYQKKARRPGRKKRGETDAQFEARVQEAAERPTERVVGRRSNSLFSAPNSFQRLRQSLSDHLQPLGIEYGDNLHPHDPDPQTTRQNLKEEIAELKAQKAQLEEAISQSPLTQLREENAALRKSLRGWKALYELVMELATKRMGEAVRFAFKEDLKDRWGAHPENPDRGEGHHRASPRPSGPSMS